VSQAARKLDFMHHFFWFLDQIVEISHVLVLGELLVGTESLENMTVLT